MMDMVDMQLQVSLGQKRRDNLVNDVEVMKWCRIMRFLLVSILDDLTRVHTCQLT